MTLFEKVQKALLDVGLRVTGTNMSRDRIEIKADILSDGCSLCIEGPSMRSEFNVGDVIYCKGGFPEEVMAFAKTLDGQDVMIVAEEGSGVLYHRAGVTPDHVDRVKEENKRPTSRTLFGRITNYMDRHGLKHPPVAPLSQMISREPCKVVFDEEKFQELVREKLNFHQGGPVDMSSVPVHLDREIKGHWDLKEDDVEPTCTCHQPWNFGHDADCAWAKWKEKQDDA